MCNARVTALLAHPSTVDHPSDTLPGTKPPVLLLKGGFLLLEQLSRAAGSVQDILPHLQMTALSLSHLPQCRNADGCTTIHFLLPRPSSYTPPFHFSTPTPAPVFHSSAIQYLLSSFASACIFFQIKDLKIAFYHHWNKAKPSIHTLVSRQPK